MLFLSSNVDLKLFPFYAFEIYKRGFIYQILLLVCRSYCAILLFHFATILPVEIRI